MSDESFMYDEDELESLSGNELVNALRKQLRAASKEVKTLKETSSTDKAAIADLTKRVNGASLNELLKAAGAKPQIAKFMQDVEPTEDAVKAWLSENGELFGFNPEAKDEQKQQETAPPAGQQQGLDPAMAEALAAMTRAQQQEANAAPGLLGNDGGADEFIKRVGQNAKSFEDVEKALRQGGLFR